MENAEESGILYALYVFLAGWILWVARRHDFSLRRMIGSVPEGYNWGGLAGLLIVTMVCSFTSFVVLAYGLLALAPEVLEFQFDALMQSPSASSLAGNLSLAVLTVLVAPVVEETLFRGVLINRWGSKWSVGAAVIVSSIAFGVLHLNPLGLTVVGAITAVLYLSTRSLIVPMVFHAANNLIVILPTFISLPGMDSVGREGDSERPEDFATFSQDLQETFPLALAFFLVTLAFLIWYVRRHWPERGAVVPYMAASRPPAPAD